MSYTARTQCARRNARKNGSTGWGSGESARTCWGDGVGQFVDEGDHEPPVRSDLFEVRELAHAQIDSRSYAAVLGHRCTRELEGEENDETGRADRTHTHAHMPESKEWAAYHLCL